MTEVFEITVLPRATFIVSSGNDIVARNFARFAAIDVKPDKSPLETELVHRDNNKILNVETGQRTFVPPY